jgi:hypothetical protein
MTDSNNSAQSNYDRFISASASAPKRVLSEVTVGNPYHKATRFFIRAGQTNPFYRTYLENTWVQLEPGENRGIQLMFEYAPDLKNASYDEETNRSKYYSLRNNVSLVGLIENPHDKRLHEASLITGADAEVVTGKSTKIDNFDIGDNVATGEVTTMDKKPVPGGSVILIYKTRRDSKEKYITSKLGSNGQFRIPIKATWATAEAYYVPIAGYADCSSKIITNKTPKTY